jgi:hypothetical protein
VSLLTDDDEAYDLESGIMGIVGDGGRYGVEGHGGGGAFG